MSVEDANEMLWQQDSIPNKGFSSFTRSVLKELAVSHNITVDRSGKKGLSVKRDYVEAISQFVCVSIICELLRHLKSL